MLLRRVLILASVSLAVRAASDSSVSETTMPQCAVLCQKDALANNVTECAVTNTSCLCNDTAFQGNVTACVTTTCNGREQMIAKRLSDRQCGIPPHKGRPENDPGTIVPLILSTLLIANRFICKFMGLGGTWGADDLTIGIAYILAVSIFGTNISMIRYGFGQNMWDISPLDHITIMLKFFYAFTLQYKTQISLAKISVCLFLLRIFQSNVFRYTTYTVIALNAAIAVTWVITDSLHCIPVHLAWDQWETLEAGQCVNFIDVTFANAFVNIGVDTVMVLMPVYEVMHLNLSSRKKLSVSVMFAMGLLLTIVAIIRVVVFWFNRWNTNPSVQLQPIVYWSVVETHIAVICACLPTLRAMLVHLFPKLFPNAGDNSTAHKNTPSGRATFASSSQALNKSQINKTVSYTVDYDDDSKKKRPHRHSFVQLVEIDPREE
ncbi:hypothetical protein Plec18170_003674 [Paecilomyces lecythidis]